MQFIGQGVSLEELAAAEEDSHRQLHGRSRSDVEQKYEPIEISLKKLGIRMKEIDAQYRDHVVWKDPIGLLDLDDSLLHAVLVRLGPRYVKRDHDDEGKVVQIGPAWWEWDGREDDPGLQEWVEGPRVQGVFALVFDEKVHLLLLLYRLATRRCTYPARGGRSHQERQPQASVERGAAAVAARRQPHLPARCPVEGRLGDRRRHRDTSVQLLPTALAGLTPLAWYAPPMDGTSRADLYMFACGSDFKACLADFAMLSGPVPLPPLATMGHRLQATVWWSHHETYSEELDDQDARAGQVPTARAVHLSSSRRTLPPRAAAASSYPPRTHRREYSASGHGTQRKTRGRNRDKQGQKPPNVIL